MLRRTVKSIKIRIRWLARPPKTARNDATFCRARTQPKTNRKINNIPNDTAHMWRGIIVYTGFYDTVILDAKHFCNLFVCWNGAETHPRWCSSILWQFWPQFFFRSRFCFSVCCCIFLPVSRITIYVDMSILLPVLFRLPWRTLPASKVSEKRQNFGAGARRARKLERERMIGRERKR